jgi:hypothetical protein
VKSRIMLIVAITLNGTMVAHAQTPEGRQACMNDAFQFRQDAIPDRERVSSCLVAHRSVISAACHTVMAASLPVDQPPFKKAASSGEDYEDQARSSSGKERKKQSACRQADFQDLVQAGWRPPKSCTHQSWSSCFAIKFAAMCDAHHPPSMSFCRSF